MELNVEVQIEPDHIGHNVKRLFSPVYDEFQHVLQVIEGDDVFCFLSVERAWASIQLPPSSQMLLKRELQR